MYSSRRATTGSTSAILARIDGRDYHAHGRDVIAAIKEE
jgi:hypothetical protein